MRAGPALRLELALQRQLPIREGFLIGKPLNRFRAVRSHDGQLVRAPGNLSRLVSKELVAAAKPREHRCQAPLPGVVSVAPFFAKIMASSLAGTVWLAFFETSCVAPGGS